MRLILTAAALIFLKPAVSPAARLSRPAGQSFESYVSSLEGRLTSKRASPDGYVAALPDQDSVRIEPVDGGSWQVEGGLLHHWRASAFVPGATPADLLALLRDYNRLDRYYAPQVVSSHGLTGDGDRGMLALRFKERRVITVVLDAEFEVDSGLSGGNRGYSFSRSRHIWQVDQAGTPRESRRAEGADDGFLWRLNSYRSFEQKREGLLMQCDAVSLTRDVPAGLGWLIGPIIETLPRASLEFTMTATRKALGAGAARRQTDDRHN